MELASLAEGYLEAEGYDVIRRGKDLLRGTKQGIAEATDLIFVWVPDAKDLPNFRSLERPYLSRFKEIDKQYPTAQKVMLVPSREGLSQEFTRGAKSWHNVDVRVPVQFFDTAFKWDESDEAPSAANDLRKRGDQRLRVRTPQPFTYVSSGESGDDLLGTLFGKLRSRSLDKNIQVIVGPAGIGKTYLSESLFARLHSSFIEDKRSQLTVWSRPLPLLPEYMQSSTSPTIQALLDAFLRTEFARPLSPPVFEWMLANQLGAWLIDGLDEVIARDPDFFDYLLHLMTLSPEFEALPTIVICLRDSLFATNSALREFCEEYEDHIQVYELVKWKSPSKRQFASTVLGDRAGEFLTALRTHPSLDELASTPYYCQLLADQLKSGRLKETYSETALIDDALSNIIQRDYDKGIINQDVMSEADVREFVDELVHEDLKSGFQGIAVDIVRSWTEDWADLSLDSSGTNGERERFVSQMGQLGLFSQGKLGHIQFAQEILKHFLLGHRLVRLFDQDQSSGFIRDLATWQIPIHWVTLRVVAEHIREQGKFAKLLAHVIQATPNPIAFKNAVQLACLAANERGALKDVPFERRDLSDIVFKDFDLDRVSFRECDLSNAEFRDCSLRDTDFTGAVIKNTTFNLSDKEGFLGAEIGDLSRFYSMKVRRDSRELLLSDYTAAGKWFNGHTRRQPKTVDPCTAALQLRHLFGKFVHPNGSARRSKLDERGALAGKQFDNPASILDAAIRYGYLVRQKSRHTVERPDGSRYSELVAYMVNLSLSHGISGLLSDVCSRSGCEHLPQVR